MVIKNKLFLIPIFILLFCSVAFAQTTYKIRYNTQTGRGDWVVADESLYGLGTAISVGTVAGLPGSPSADDLAIVTDGADEADCTVGGGTDINLCVFDGSDWLIIGDGQAAAASGDSVTVNGVAVDTTANFLDTSDVTFGLADGGPGGPDDITIVVVNNVTAAANLADNAIVRGDGGAKGVQDSTPRIENDGRIVNVTNPINPQDVVTLDTLLDHVGIIFTSYLRGSNLLSTTLAGGETADSELLDATPVDVLSTIFYKSTVADTPTPFTLMVGDIISFHFDANINSGSKKATTLQMRLFYMDADGSSNKTAIAPISDVTGELTDSQTSYEIHSHVAVEITVPAGKRLWVEPYANTTGAQAYPIVSIYRDSGSHHIAFGVAGGILSNFVRVDGLTPMEADWEFGNFDLTLKSLTGDGTLTIPLADIESNAAIGNGSPLSSNYTLVVDRDFTDTGNANVAQVIIAGEITKNTFAPGTNMSYLQVSANGAQGPSRGITIDGVAPPLVTTVTLYEPNITGAGAIIAATLNIHDAPTEGSSNFALRVGSGATSLGGTLGVLGVSTLAGILMTGIIADNDDMVFEVDADDNGSNSFIWTDGASTQIATLDEAGAFQIADDLIVSGGDITFGNIAATIGDGVTDSITLSTDGTGPGEIVLPNDSINDDEIDNAADVMSASFGITIDGGGSAITTGVKGYIEIPYAMTIDRATFLCDQSGSIVVDVWLEQYVDYPPTNADSITASAPPTISGAIKSEDETLTGWTTTVTAGDIIGFNVDSITTVERCHLIISGNKT